MRSVRDLTGNQQNPRISVLGEHHFEPVVHDRSVGCASDPDRDHLPLAETEHVVEMIGPRLQGHPLRSVADASALGLRPTGDVVDRRLDHVRRDAVTSFIPVITVPRRSSSVQAGRGVTGNGAQGLSGGVLESGMSPSN